MEPRLELSQETLRMRRNGETLDDYEADAHEPSVLCAIFVAAVGGMLLWVALAIIGIEIVRALRL